ncbi:MAG: hypothetical protein IJ446_04290 [Oscillospiraceae bacterium]|nr:hypothetical protein [Oscillospiraceae bacterium]
MPSDKGGFISVVAPNGERLYGGRQQLLYDESSPLLSSDYNKRLSGFGCGAVAASDILAYLDGAKTGKLTISSEKFYETVLSAAEHITPDADGVRFMRGCGRFLSRRIYYYPVGITRRETLIRKISDSLSSDMPVPIAVYCPEKDEGFEMRLYGDEERISRAKAHYMVVTAIENDKLVISSWGKKYLMDIDMLRAKSRKRLVSAFGTAVFIIGK